MLKVIMLITFLAFSAKAAGSTEEVEFREPIFPIVLGAVLITWGAYELGQDTASSQRNVKVLWGGTLTISAGLVLFEFSKKKSSKIALTKNISDGMSITYGYHF